MSPLRRLSLAGGPTRGVDRHRATYIHVSAPKRAKGRQKKVSCGRGQIEKKYTHLCRCAVAKYLNPSAEALDKLVRETPP